MASPTRRCSLRFVNVPRPDSHEVLVLVMAAGVNYNGVWAGLGEPISMIRRPQAALSTSPAPMPPGIVWAVGDKVKRWKVGDEVVIHCNQDDGDDEECNGGDPMHSPTPADLGLRDAGRFLCPVHPRAGATADAAAAAPDLGGERLLHADPRHRLPDAVRPPPPYRLKPGQNVLVWGASGGLGSYAIQLINTAGANAIGVISDEDKRDFVMSLGAKGVINRKEFDCWGQLPTVNSPRVQRSGSPKCASSARRSGTSLARA